MTVDLRLPSRPVPGTGISASPLGVSLNARPGGFEDPSRLAAELRMLRARGITVFDLADAREPRWAEGILAEAFPGGGADLVVVLGHAALPSDPSSPPSSLLERIHASLKESRRRLGPGLQVVVEVRSDARSPAPMEPTLAALDRLVGEGTIAGRSVRLDLAPGGFGPLELPSAPLLSVRLSLLDRGTMRSLDERAATTPTGVIVRDPFAGGRLDGSRASAALGERTPGQRPIEVEELRKEFAPVLDLGFLTAGRQRTLPQAAVQYLLSRRWVTTVLVADPSTAQWNALLGTDGGLGTPLSHAELARLDDDSSLSGPGGVGVVRGK